MPDFPELPHYLQPKHDNPESWIMSAMEFGARQKQQQRNFALEVDQFHLKEQEANVKMAGEVMANKQRADEAADGVPLMAYFDALQTNPDTPPPTGLKTLKARTAAMQMGDKVKMSTAQGEAQLQWNSNYREVIAHNLNAEAEINQFKPGSTEWKKSVSGWYEWMKVDKANEAFLKSQSDVEMKQNAIGDRQIAAIEARGENQKDVQELRNQGTIESAKIRSTKSVDAAQKWMDHAKWTSYKARMDAIQKDSETDSAAKKHAAMDAVDTKYGVKPGIDNANTPAAPADTVPSDPAMRDIGKSYKLPKGTFKWNGHGWETP